MKQRSMILLFGFWVFLGFLVLAGAMAQTARAKSIADTDRWTNGAGRFPAPDLTVASRFIWMPWFAAVEKKPGTAGVFFGPMQNPCAGLTPDKIRAGGVTVLQCKLHCEKILPAGSAINSRSDEELWACINGSVDQPPVEDVPLVPENPVLPEPESPVDPVEPVSPKAACAGVTPYDFRVGSLESMECRILCDEGSYQSDEELWACINYYGGQPGDGSSIPPVNPPGEDVPIPPVEPPTSEQPGSLGPLATNPFIPLAGALIGTIVGWLTSVAATSGNVLKTLVAPPLKPGQPSQTPAQPETPVPLPGQTPSAPTTNILTPETPTAAPESLKEQLWDMTMNLVGSSATVTGSLSEFFDFQDDAKTVKKISDSLQAWRNNPTRDAAEAYYKNLRGMTRQNAVLEKAGKLLGNAANVLDGVDGVLKGMKKADERGYSGSDYAMTIAAEEGKKILNFVLTKNPVVGLANSALGGATEMVYGKDGRIDVGEMIEKGADAWDNTTQEYAGYTGGDLFAPDNKDFAEALAKDPEQQRKDQYLHGIRQIKKLVEQGKITLQEGGARIRRLRDSIL